MLGRIGCMLPEFIMQQARLVIGIVGVHRAEDADVVDAAADLGKSSLTSMPLWP